MQISEAADCWGTGGGRSSPRQPVESPEHLGVLGKEAELGGRGGLCPSMDAARHPVSCRFRGTRISEGGGEVQVWEVYFILCLCCITC